MFRPNYLRLFSSGELRDRMLSLNEKLVNCTICPKDCMINRMEEATGYCQSGENAIVASYCDHHGEEPVLSGYNGSGTIFFGHCNLNCVYCQNFDISQNLHQMENHQVTADQLADIMMYLQNIKHCHNINFVSPTHFVPQIVEAIYLAVEKGLKIPLVYNSNGYDSLETIRLLDGIIDIYLPDLKYSNNTFAQKYSDIENYVEYSRQAIKEMFRQVGTLKVDENDLAQKGLIIRHLVLPENISGTKENLKWIAEELSKEVTVNLMDQYYPANHAANFPALSRKLNDSEYEDALTTYKQLGFSNGLL